MSDYKMNPTVLAASFRKLRENEEILLRTRVLSYLEYYWRSFQHGMTEPEFVAVVEEGLGPVYAIEFQERIASA